LAARLEVAIGLLVDPEEAVVGRILSSDRSDEIVRPYTTEKDENPVCRGASADDGNGRAADALRHITLDMLAAALPFDWRAGIEKSGRLNWPNLVATAYERAAGIGVTAAIWAEAQAELGRAGAAVLVLLADAGSVECRGTIRCPAAWVRAMAARAETEPLRLRRNLFGFLQREQEANVPCPGPIDRITDRPPEPPFDTCTMSDGSTYDAAKVALARPSSQSRAGWDLPRDGADGVRRNRRWHLRSAELLSRCRVHAPIFMGRPEYWFLGAPVAAERVAFRFQLTIPTDTAGEPHVSPVFLSNPDTGFSLTLTADELRALEEQPTIQLESAP